MLKRIWRTGKLLKINLLSAHKLWIRFYRGVINAPPSLLLSVLKANFRTKSEKNYVNLSCSGEVALLQCLNNEDSIKNPPTEIWPM